MAGGKYANAASEAMAMLGVSPDTDMGEVTGARAQPVMVQEGEPTVIDQVLAMVSEMAPNERAMLIDAVSTMMEEGMEEESAPKKKAAPKEEMPEEEEDE